MKIILFYLKVLVLRSLNWKNAVISSFIALTVFYIIQYVDHSLIDQKIISQVHSFGLVFITVIATTSFFPLYVSRIEIIKNHFPVRLYNKYLIEAIVNCLNVRSILIILTILLIWSFTKSTLVALNLLIFSFSIFLIEQNLKLLYEGSKGKYAIVKIVLNLALVPLGITYILKSIDSWVVILITLTFFIFSIILHILSRNIQDKSSTESLVGAKLDLNLTTIYLRVMFRNNSVLSFTGLWLMFVKLLFLPVYFKDFKSEGDTIENDGLTIVIFALLTVVPIFTYIFNNLWGFLKNTFLTISTRTEKTMGAFQFYMTVLTPFVLVDLTYNLIYVYIGNRLTYSFALFYFSILFLAIAIGLICSGIRPAKVIKSDSFFNFKTHTYLIGNILLLGSAFVLSYLYLNSQYFLIISLGVMLLAISMIGIYIWKYSYRIIKSTTEKLLLN